MADPESDQKPDDKYVGDLRSRFGDVGKGPEGSGRWAAIKDRLAIGCVIFVLVLLAFLMVDGWVVNFRCTFAEFVTFECNRWKGEEHPSLQRLDESPAGGSDRR